MLGARPAEPGFKTVRIAPHLGSLRQGAGRVPHPRGEIVVRLARADAGGLRSEVTLPEGLNGVLEWARERGGAAGPAGGVVLSHRTLSPTARNAHCSA